MGDTTFGARSWSSRSRVQQGLAGSLQVASGVFNRFVQVYNIRTPESKGVAQLSSAVDCRFMHIISLDTVGSDYPVARQIRVEKIAGSAREAREACCVEILSELTGNDDLDFVSPWPALTMCFVPQNQWPALEFHTMACRHLCIAASGVCLVGLQAVWYNSDEQPVQLNAELVRLVAERKKAKAGPSKFGPIPK
eukprot:gene4821-4978_t